MRYVIFTGKFKEVSYFEKSYARGGCRVFRDYTAKRFKMGAWRFLQLKILYQTSKSHAYTLLAVRKHEKEDIKISQQKMDEPWQRGSVRPEEKRVFRFYILGRLNSTDYVGGKMEHVTINVCYVYQLCAQEKDEDSYVNLFFGKAGFNGKIGLLPFR